MRYALALLLLSALLANAQEDSPEQLVSLRDSTLAQPDRLALQHALQKSAGRTKPTDEQILNTKVRAVDLNDDDDPEILAQSITCDAGGNCAFWVLQKKGAAYKVLLKSNAKNYRIRTIETGGFSDIELGHQESEYRTEWRGYKFDGARYIKVKCWANVTGDEEHEKPFAKPKVEPCKK